MRAVRAVSIPIDHPIAEVAAFPFGSERSLELGVHQLDPRLQASGTQRLWRAAEGLLLAAFPAFSVEEVVSVRDRMWFSLGAESTLSLDRYARELAGMFLCATGGVLRPSLRDERGRGSNPIVDTGMRARQAWRWLTFAMPPDFLAAASTLDANAPWRIELMPPIVARCLETHGYAESHLHYGAAFDFSSFWVATMRALADPGTTRESLASPGAVLDGGRLLLPWLLRAVLARYCIAAYLRDRRCGGGDRAMADWVENRLLPLVSRLLGETRALRLWLVLDDLLQSRDVSSERDDAAIRSLYREVTGIGYRKPPDRFAAIYGDDPIAVLVAPNAQGSAPPEVAFIRAALTYLGDHPDDHGFAGLLWQAVRIRNLLYRHVTQRPLTPGLQWFVRTFGRL